MTDSTIALHKAKHLLSHVLVAAGAKRWPAVALGESGETKTGFYADFGIPEALSEEALQELGDEMARILLDSQDFRDFSLNPEQARQVFAGQPWKTFQVEALAEFRPEIRCYELDGVIDVCDCAIKSPEELRAIHPEKFLLTGSHPAIWSNRGKDEFFVRIRGELFPAPVPCGCCPA